MTDRAEGSHAATARAIVGAASEGALGTVAHAVAGHPYVSQVLYTLVGERPVFLLSGLAEHTKNLEADPRASLLVLEPRPVGAEPLTTGRVTLLGLCARVDRATVEDVFLARHPEARRYASLPDFAYWALDVASARYVGGFGRMSWIDGAAWRVG